MNSPIGDWRMIARACLLLAALSLIFLKQSVPQTYGNSDFHFEPFVGEVKWGHVFHKSLSHNLTFSVQLLGGGHGQIGAYVSIVNERNPKTHKFVVLPELNNGQESNFIGIFIPGGIEPDWHVEAESLRSALEQNRNAGQEINFLIDDLRGSDLDKVIEAWLTLMHHGLDEEQYAQAREILDALHRATGIFTILGYRITVKPLRIDSLRFSFSP